MNKIHRRGPHRDTALDKTAECRKINDCQINPFVHVLKVVNLGFTHHPLGSRLLGDSAFRAAEWMRAAWRVSADLAAASRTAFGDADAGPVNAGV